MQLKIVIVGGGLGGLETVLALSQDGHELLVLEAAPQFGEVPTSSLSHTDMSIRWVQEFEFRPIPPNSIFDGVLISVL